MAKYLDVSAMSMQALRRVHGLFLDFLPPERGVDVGGGLGYFAYVCQRWNHQIITLDQGGDLREAAAAILGVPFLAHTVRPFAPLPDLGPINLVTVMRVNLMQLGWDGWVWFARDALERLPSGGRLVVEPNHGHFALDVKRWQRELGGYAECRPVRLDCEGMEIQKR